MTDPSRMRDHPGERFAPAVRELSLTDTADTLRREQGGGQHGHRQQVLHKHGPMTIALFDFDRDAVLAEHSAAGTVAIQVLQGELEVRADGRPHALAAGRLLVLAPGVRHQVRAVRPSTMLLTVCLEPRSGAQPDTRP